MGKGLAGIAKTITKFNPITNALGLGAEDQQGAYTQTGDIQDFYRNYDREMGLADKGVQNSVLTRDVYGEGGLQGQLAKEQSQLANQGFQLTQDDRTAYGQAAGDIARQFGQQEQDISKSLARRGLASAGSGAALQQFAGAAGNKNEMLAGAQMQIAQKRYQDTQNRLQNVRNQMQSLAGQGSQLSQQRYAGKGAGLEAGANAETAQRQNQQAALKPGLLSTIGQGVQAGIGTLATQAPGMAATGGSSIAMPGFGMGGGGQGMQPQAASANTKRASLYGNYA